jgi:hypothetical protein
MVSYLSKSATKMKFYSPDRTASHEWMLPTTWEVFERMFGVNTAPSRLYHYTDSSGLLGINRECGLWASDLRYVNDASELKEAAKVFFDILKMRIEEFPELLREVISWLDEDVWLRWEDTAVYAISFSEVGDSLGHWRGYCPNGKGYSLGFDPRQFAEHVPLPWRLVPCIYGSSEQQELMNVVVSSAIQYVKGGIENGSSLDILKSDLYLGMIFQFLTMAPFFKNSAFREEREWRLALRFSSGNTNVNYRSRNGALLPYVSFPLKLSSGEIWKVTELIVGPTHHKELGLLAARGFAEQSRLGIEVVQSSTIPYQVT